MANSDRDRKTTLLIIGKAGNGKASTGNSILRSSVFAGDSGKKTEFEVTDCVSSDAPDCKTMVQTIDNGKIRLVCAPDLQRKRKTERELEDEEIKSWLKECEGEPDAVLLVMRSDHRCSPEEIKAYEHLRDHSALMREKLVVVFTMGDRLNGLDLRELLEEDASYLKPVQDIWAHDAGKRYVVFDNTATGSALDVQVNALMSVVSTHKPHPYPQHVCRLLFVGEILSLKKMQAKVGVRRSKLEVFQHKEMDGLQVEMTFLPGDTNNDAELDRIMISTSPGPHAILTRHMAAETKKHAVEKLELVFGSFMNLREFIIEKDLDTFSDSDLKKLVHDEIPKRGRWKPELCGAYFRNEHLRKKAMEIHDETTKQIKRNKKTSESTYNTYLTVKEGIVDK